MAFSTTKNIGLYKVGDTFNIELDGVTYPSIRNLGPDLAKNVSVQVTIPAELTFNAGQSTVPRGTFSEITGIWDLGTLLIGESLTPMFSFEILDDCIGEYNITFDISSDMCECNFANNSFSIVVSGTPCCIFGECVAIGSKTTFTSYSEQGDDFEYTVCDDFNKVLLITPTSDIELTLVGGSSDCIADEITIKHVGTGANALYKIRVVASSGDVDGDTYFEFDNTGVGLNNSRGYNFSAYKFKWDGTDFWVF